MADRYGLSKEVFSRIINTFKNYSQYIEEVVLFGSRARGDYKPASDIDIAIKFRELEIIKRMTLLLMLPLRDLSLLMNYRGN